MDACRFVSISSASRQHGVSIAHDFAAASRDRAKNLTFDRTKINGHHLSVAGRRRSINAQR
jgi:hypothetical protein